MNKRKCLSLTSALIGMAFLALSYLSLGVIPAMAEDILEMSVPEVTDENKITIDGIADEGEYEVAYTMDHTNGVAWVGNLKKGTSSTWRMAWDDKGFYLCVTATDSTPVYRGADTNWVGIDCVEIGLNPGYVLTKDGDKGVFFSMGAMANGEVVVYRHNYDEKIVSREVQAVATGHIEGSDCYTIEMCIPWSLIFIEADCTKTDTHLDATHLSPSADLEMDIVLAHIDATDAQTISVAYKLEDTDFVTDKYITGSLVGGKGSATEADTTPATQPTEGTNAETVVLLEPSTHVETLTDPTPQQTQSYDTQPEAMTRQTTDGGCASLMGISSFGVLELAVLGFFKSARRKK